MDLRTLLHPVVDYQKVTVVVGGACITAPSWALFNSLADEVINKQVIEIVAEENVLKVWVKND